MIGHPPVAPDCRVCHGEGERTINPSWPFDPQQETSELCRACNGTGKATNGERKDDSHAPARLEAPARDLRTAA